MNSNIIKTIAIIVCLGAAGFISWRNYGPKQQPQKHRQKSSKPAPKAKVIEKPDPNRKSADGWPAIVEAAYRGDKHQVAALLEAGADIEAFGPAQWTALMQAAGNGHTEVVQLLVDAGAFVPGENKVFRNAYDLAVERGHTDIATMLEPIGKATNEARTLCAAAEMNDAKTIRAMLKTGADINAVDGQGRSALFYVMIHTNPLRYGDHIHKIDDSFVQSMLENGANPNVRDRNGQTVLAAYMDEKSDPTLISMLVEHGADLQTIDKEGNTLLHQPCSPEVAKQLVDAGVSVNASNAAGDTPLHQQIAYRNASVVGLLLDAGADPTALNKRQQTPAERLGERGHYPAQQKPWDAIQKLLSERGLLQP